MTQAKGILPKGHDAAMRSPLATGYFICVSVDPQVTREEIVQFLTQCKNALDALVLEEGGRDVADVVVGFHPKFFGSVASPRFESPFQLPAGFSALPPVPGTPVDCDLVFYVVSIDEARVATFISQLWALKPILSRIELDRGYQKLREGEAIEAFGYRDGVRNVRTIERYGVVFIHEDDQPEESSGLEGGSYMAFLRIVQDLEAFNALEASAQDQVIGRRRDGSRLDLPEGSDPRKETEMAPTEPPPFTSHVRKVGPRGPHDDVQIFRRGLPFIELTGGTVRQGLNFVSFQASLDQFDVVFNDWMMNPNFPPPETGATPGVDRLFDPNLGIAQIEKSGFFFVPPHDDRYIGATLFDEPRGKGKPRTGQVSVRKKVIDPANPGNRFERGGFTFQLIDQNGAVVAEFTTDSKGHAQSPEVPLGTYTLRELPTNRLNIAVAGDQSVTLDSKHEVVVVQDTVTQPGGYGTR